MTRLISRPIGETKTVVHKYSRDFLLTGDLRMTCEACKVVKGDRIGGTMAFAGSEITPRRGTAL
jgi:hypothetical protein